MRRKNTTRILYENPTRSRSVGQLERRARWPPTGGRQNFREFHTKTPQLLYNFGGQHSPNSMTRYITLYNVLERTARWQSTGAAAAAGSRRRFVSYRRLFVDAVAKRGPDVRRPLPPVEAAARRHGFLYYKAFPPNVHLTTFFCRQEVRLRAYVYLLFRFLFVRLSFLSFFFVRIFGKGGVYRWSMLRRTRHNLGRQKHNNIRIGVFFSNNSFPRCSKVVRVPVPPSTSHFRFEYPRDSRGLSHSAP